MSICTPVLQITLTEGGLIQWAKHRTAGALFPYGMDTVPIAPDGHFGGYREYWLRPDCAPVAPPRGYVSPEIGGDGRADHVFLTPLSILRLRWESARGSWAEVTPSPMSDGRWTLRVGGPPDSLYIISALALVAERLGWPNERAYPTTYGDFARWDDDTGKALADRLASLDSPRWMRALGRLIECEFGRPLPADWSSMDRTHMSLCQLGDELVRRAWARAAGGAA